MDNELKHYGVPGMKWGVRRTTKNLKLLSKAGAGAIKTTKNTVKAEQKAANAISKSFTKSVNNTVKDEQKAANAISKSFTKSVNNTVKAEQKVANRIINKAKKQTVKSINRYKKIGKSIASPIVKAIGSKKVKDLKSN